MDEPGPAGAEPGDAGRFELVLEGVEGAELLVDRRAQVAARLAAAVGAHHLPEERVVEVAAGVVADRALLVVGEAGEVAQDLLDVAIGPLRALERGVRFVDVGLVVLVVVDAHRRLVDVGLEGVVGVGKVGNGESHLELLLIGFRGLRRSLTCPVCRRLRTGTRRSSGITTVGITAARPSEAPGRRLEHTDGCTGPHRRSRRPGPGPRRALPANASSGAASPATATRRPARSSCAATWLSRNASRSATAAPASPSTTSSRSPTSALLNAVDRFDPERGIPFTAFASPTILGELKRHFRDRVWTVRVPRGLHDRMAEVDKAITELTKELQHSPSVGRDRRAPGAGPERRARGPRGQPQPPAPVARPARRAAMTPRKPRRRSGSEARTRASSWSRAGSLSTRRSPTSTSASGWCCGCGSSTT